MGQRQVKPKPKAKSKPKPPSTSKRYSTPVPSKRVTKYDDEVFDLHPTPAAFTEVLFPHRRLQTGAVVWEPACGQGDMAEVIKSHGHKVVSTDLKPWGYGKGGVDFLKAKKPLAPFIITNPPYALSLDFVKKGLDWLRSQEVFVMALLIKVEFMAGEERYREVFRDNRPESIIVIPDRMINAHTGSTYSFWHAWYVWTLRGLTSLNPPSIQWDPAEEIK